MGKFSNSLGLGALCALLSPVILACEHDNAGWLFLWLLFVPVYILLFWDSRRPE